MTIRVALRSVSLESRRSDDMVRLMQRHGLQPIEAPSMREVPLDNQAEAFAFGEALMAGGCDFLVLLTGVGTRTLIATLSSRWPQAEVVAAIGKTQLVCRGPKPVAALKEIGLKPQVVAPEPNTWRELLQALEPITLSGKQVWVQEYGRSNAALLAALRDRGAQVRSAAVYAWQLPEDIAPLRRAIRCLCDGTADAILFTAAQQFEHLISVATDQGDRDELLKALATKIVIASIGPVTTEALREHGLQVDIEPEHPKMGHLIKALAHDGVYQLERKRSAMRAPAAEQ
jgi:uroporphyrinogen-III synthase